MQVKHCSTLGCIRAPRDPSSRSQTKRESICPPFPGFISPTTADKLPPRSAAARAAISAASATRSATASATGATAVMTTVVSAASGLTTLTIAIEILLGARFVCFFVPTLEGHRTFTLGRRLAALRHHLGALLFQNGLAR